MSYNTHSSFYIFRLRDNRKENVMPNVAILYCKRIKDHSCIACAKCFKGIKEKNGEFARYDEINLVAMTDCGDCPGLTVPRVKLLSDVAQSLDRPIDVVHLGTCVKAAINTAQCPIQFDEVKAAIKERFGCEVVLGTHAY
jgi:predicted metal-binding protein